MEESQRKRVLLLVFILLLFFIGIGYAILNTTLNINGTGHITNATWDVHFENPQATSNSTVVPSIAPSAPSASKLQSINYTVSFDSPGDVYEFTVDVANHGSIDAMINQITSTYQIGNMAAVDLTHNNPPSYLTYYVTYSSGAEVAPKQKLEHQTTETLIVHIEYNRELTNVQFEESQGKTITFTYGLDFVQTDGSEVAVVHP